MSSAPNSAVQPESATLNLAKPERMLAGFPWVSAIVLYTLSWGWSLLRPNTLFWDDWAQFFQRSPFYVRQVYIDSGRPLWEGIAEGLLIHLGLWAFFVATFLFFLLCGIFVFAILKSFSVLALEVVSSLTVLFLVLPVNHARISLVIFDYTSAYFLFYLGWFLLVRYRSVKGFVLACVILFLSFKTHSFLFFVLLPFLHFCWLNKLRLLDFKKLSGAHLQVAIIAVMPVLYVFARSVFWPPIESWQDYQQPTSAGLLIGLWPVLIGLVALSAIGWRKLKQKRTHLGLNLLIVSVEDQLLRFNGRENSFRGYEWSGFMTLAGIPTDRPGCEVRPNGSALTLKSDTSYLRALVTRDLGLYFEVKPCSEVLAQNG